MAVLLVATFPILLLISSPLAWGGAAVGILLLYLDNRQHGLAMRHLSVSPVSFRQRVRGRIRQLTPAVSPAPKGDDTALNGPHAEAA